MSSALFKLNYYKNPWHMNQRFIMFHMHIYLYLYNVDMFIHLLDILSFITNTPFGSLKLDNGLGIFSIV
jgi:hypothetical protein